MSTIEKTFSNGEVIIKEGDSGNTFYQLLEGKVAVYKNYGKDDQVQIAILEPGQYFGEMAVIEKTYPRSTTIVATGDVKVTEIAAEELNDYITQHPDKILAIMKLLGSRIKAMTADYNEAKKTLDDIRKADSGNKYDGFFNSMINRSIYMTAKNFRLERPSIEALREASELVSKQDSDGVLLCYEAEKGYLKNDVTLFATYDTRAGHLLTSSVLILVIQVSSNPSFVLLLTSREDRRVALTQRFTSSVLLEISSVASSQQS